MDYNKIRNQVRKYTRQTIRNHEKNIARHVKDNPKKFWNFAQSKLKTKSCIPDLYKTESKEEVTESDKEKADFFTFVFTKETDSEMSEIMQKDVPCIQDY